MLAYADVPVPGFAIVRDVNAIPETHELAYPQIVTQAFDDTYEYEGHTQPVKSREELETRIAELATEYDMPLLIEEFIDGRQLQAIVVGNRVLDVQPLTERVFDDETKTESMAVAQLDLDTVGRIRQLARRAFRAMACRDIAQVDFCLDEEGNLFVIDVRPSLDTGPGSAFRVAAEATEHGFDGLIVEMAKTTLARVGTAIPAVPTAAPSAPSSSQEPLADSATGAGMAEEAGAPRPPSEDV